MEEKLIPLAPNPKGVNQRAAETDLPEGSLREAINVTLDAAGKAKRRAGYQRIVELGNAHSLWSNDSVMLLVDGGDLYRYDPEQVTAQLVHTGAGGAPLSYAQANEWLFYTSERVNGRINLYNPDEHYPYWGVPQPTGLTLSASAGTLPPGQYQVAVTYASASGEESGADAPMVITLGGTEGIQLNHLQAPAGVDRVHIYCSMLNDTQLYRQATIPAGPSEYVITQLRRGKLCTTLFQEPLPSGHLIHAYRGRLFVAKDNVVYFSKGLSYSLYEPDNGYLPPFPEKVSMIVAVEDGLYIGADKTYFLRGNGPDEFSISVVDQGKPVLGSALSINAQLVIPEYVGTVAYWVDSEGPCFGVNGGMVQHTSISTLAGVSASRGASGILRDDGVDRVVTSLLGGAPRNGFAAQDSATIEVVRSVGA